MAHLDRPATQNEVTYDLKAGEPTSLTFRGVRLEVVEAGNDGIKLRIVAEESARLGALKEEFQSSGSF